MASITISSENAIQACKKYERTDHVWIGAGGPEYGKMDQMVRKIKNLAEYSMVPSKEGDGLKSNSMAMITIDHEDFSLIGKYLTGDGQ